MKGAILLVEDEAAIADTLQYTLERESFSVHWVTGGEDALELLAESSFALVILDIGLPDINGFEVLKKLRSFSDVPIIFLTAHNNEIDRVVGLEIGADDYVTKPFSPREVVARVKVVLRRVQQTSCAVEASRNFFTVDESTASISFLQRPLVLTRAEYLLLQALLERPGRVLSRSQLMDRIWQQPHPSDERTIDTHIKAIRAKLREISSDSDPIRTHRGFGYSVEA